MNKLFTILLFTIVSLILTTSCSKYRYESVKGDPTESRIYTLDNGLKVYLSRNTDEPRIQTFIAVKVGSKNDPLETTGLAHYFEHLMFKGSDKFGTQDFTKEKPMLDSIEMLFEIYRKETDSLQRQKIYTVIDSISNEASKIAIPNEYDKLMSTIGSEGTNAWTSFDETCYTEDIPSNQLENWATIQSERFRNAIIRGFHTELETVYEEYNMSLTRDVNKEYYKILELLFPNHPYGMHTVLGKQEHLKNPSITNIKKYYNTYYVPNNYAICLAGDLEFDKTIEIIDKHFGHIKPNKELPKLEIAKDEPIDSPIIDTIKGLESENVMLGWRTEKASSKERLIDLLAADILNNNGQCGLLDIDLIQNQKLLNVGVSADNYADKGMFIIMGFPKEGQTLKEVKELILNEISKIRNGEFDSTLITSAIANYKLNEMERLESNAGRSEQFINSYINDIPWKDIVEENNNISKITKKDIVEWAKDKLKDNNYAIIYKIKGIDNTQKKIEKPKITPIETNRNECSAFLDSIQKVEVVPIQPVFVDFKKDMEITNTKNNIPVLYKQNITNDLFSLKYIYETGYNSDLELGFAVNSYFPLLGTLDRTLQEIKNELYSLACSFNFSVRGDRTEISISGLGENMEKAVTIVEDYIANVKGDETILSELKKDELQKRVNNKESQTANFQALTNYSKYGKDVISKSVLTNKQIMALSSDSLIKSIKKLKGYNHRISYYGSLSSQELIDKLDKCHIVADKLENPEKISYSPIVVNKNKVIFAQYDAKQIYYRQYSCRKSQYDISIEPARYMFNNYFGGNMNSIVFQEMREARGLAYSAWAYYYYGRLKNDPYIFEAFIATQNDKVHQAIEGFEEIIENLPISEHAYEIAKKYSITSLATNRTSKENILRSWINAQDMGIDFDINKLIYDSIQNMTLDDLKTFHEKNIKGRQYNYQILGDWNDVDQEYLKSLGEIEKVSKEDIFGY